MESPQKFLAIRGGAQVKQEPPLDDESFMDSTDFEAFIPDGFLCKEEIDINWDDNNDSIDTTNDISKFPKQSYSIIVNNIQVNSQPNEFLNIATSSSKSISIECHKCSKVLGSRRGLASHLRHCQQKVNYLCNKCSFVTSNKALLKLHYDEMHITQVCPKCTLVCENKQTFVKHFNQFCNQNAMNISCKKCTYKCNTELMLKEHVKLLHSDEPAKQARKFITQDRLKPIISNSNTLKTIKLVSATSLYSKNYNNTAEDEISESMPSKVQSKAAKPNTVASKTVSKLTVTKIVDEDHYKIYQIVPKTKQQKNNPIKDKGKTAKVTKICQECDTQTEFDIANKCVKCNVDSIFRCNQCFKNFTNYQKVSYHLWTECTFNGVYYCLKCDFKSPCKFRVLDHCDKLHPEIHDPLESAVEADYIEFREFNSKTGNADIPVLKCPICDLQFEQSFVYKSHLNDCRQRHIAEQNIKAGATKKRKDDIVGAESSKNTSRLLPEKVSKYVAQYCAKCDKSMDVDPDNLRNLQPCDGCSSRGHMCFKCLKCKKIYKNYERVRRHLKNGCTQQLLKCAECEYMGTIFNLTKHRQDTHNTFSKPCRYCGKIFGDKLCYNKHLGYCRKPFQLYFCDACPFETETKLNLKKHIYSVHFLSLAKKDFASKSCGNRRNDRFKNSSNYLQAYCTKCCERFSLKLRVKNCPKCKEMLHFICRICGRSSTIDDARACEHIKTHSELLQFICSNCGKGFSAYDRRDFHMTFCVKKFPKENECDDLISSCGQIFSVENKRQDTNKSVRSKSFIKIEEKQYKKKQDTKKNDRGRSFSVIEKQDTQTAACETTPESYACQFCTYVSTVKAQVQRHERYEHSEDLKKLNELMNPPKLQSFECNVCSCKYSGKIDNVRLHILRRHVDVQNKSKIPPCEKCNWDFKGTHGLKKHLAYCGKKLYMPCRVNLTRINLKPVVSSRNSSLTIKEEILDLNDIEIKMET